MMRNRRLGRFVLEVCFLAGLAALATLARMHPAAVIGVMAFGWVVVALAEWSSWLDRPHFGRGLPPRYYVPQVSLPPPVPREQAAFGQVHRSLDADNEQTWVVAGSDWAEAFPGWPVLDVDEIGADTQIAVFEGLDPGTLDETLHGTAATDAPTELFDPGPELELARHEPPAATPVVPLPALDPDLDLDDREPDVEAPAEPTPARAEGFARHRIDPFASAGVGRFRRRRRHAGSGIEVPDRPPADRQLPTSIRPAPSPRT
jgi:hypothetical protein